MTSAELSSLKTFVSKVEHSNSYVPDIFELQETCSLITKSSDITSSKLQTDVLRSISYLVLDNEIDGQSKEVCLETISNIIRPDLLQNLIEDLIPMLVQIRNNRVSSSGRLKLNTTAQLKPHLGFSFGEDKAREEWQSKGGLRSLSLFFVVLSYMDHKDISSNLWWITPGILNIMDDTTDVLGIRLKGAKLLRCLLDETIDLDDSAHFDFTATGLFETYHSSLNSMWFLFPPSTDAKITEQVWETVFPTLLSLYKVQFVRNESLYYKHIRKLLSEVLLQGTIPRIATDHTFLTVNVLKYIQTLLDILGERSVSHIQRLIYTLGEFLVRNPFITLFAPLLNETIKTLRKAVQLCPTERVAAHKYDLLACAIILYQKCSTEGALDPETLRILQGFALLLQEKGCELNNTEKDAFDKKHLRELFNY